MNKILNDIWILIKKYSIYLLLIISISFNFIQRSCSNKKTVTITRTIKSPEIKGTILESNIQYLNNNSNTIKYNSKLTYPEDKLAVVNNENTQRQLDLYIKENDSLKRLKMYGDAITVHEQINIFENDDLKAEIKSKTEGKLLNISLTNYIIKSRELPIEITQETPKETKFALYAGGGLYYSGEDQKLRYKAGISFQNKKGDLLSLESDLKKQPTIFLDYKFRILNYKK